MPLTKGTSPNGATVWELAERSDGYGISLRYTNNVGGSRVIYTFRFTQSVKDLHSALGKLLIEEARRASA